MNNKIMVFGYLSAQEIMGIDELITRDYINNKINNEEWYSEYNWFKIEDDNLYQLTEEEYDKFDDDYKFGFYDVFSHYEKDWWASSEVKEYEGKIKALKEKIINIKGYNVKANHKRFLYKVKTHAGLCFEYENSNLDMDQFKNSTTSFMGVDIKNYKHYKTIVQYELTD